MMKDAISRIEHQKSMRAQLEALSKLLLGSNSDATSSPCKILKNLFNNIFAGLIL